jgi:hypothetical protein
MSFQFKSLLDAYVAFFLMQWIAMLVLDRVELQVRMRGLGGEPARAPILWFGPGSALILARLYVVWLMIQLVQVFFGHRGAGPGPTRTEGQILGSLLLFLVGLVGATALLVATNEWRRRKISLADYSVSRGQLHTSFRRLASRAGFLFSESSPLYVLPEEDFPRLCRHLRWGVIVPRRLLDELSRREIDSIAAFQLAFQSRRFYNQSSWYLLAANCGAAGAAWLLRLGSLSTGLLLLTMLAAEILAIHYLAPAMIVRAYVYAIELAGDPEAFFAAQGALERSGGAPMPKKRLQELGRRARLSPDRIAALLASRPEAEPQDRYPTTGSYMETGL